MEGMVGEKDQCHLELEKMMIEDEGDGKFVDVSRKMLVMANFLPCWMKGEYYS